MIELCHSSFKEFTVDYLRGSRLQKAHGIKVNKLKGGQFEPSLKGGRFYDGYRLNVYEAPEPNNINWEFVHVTNFDKWMARIMTTSLYLLVLIGGFLIIFLLKYAQVHELEHWIEKFEEGKGEEKEDAALKMKLLSYLTYLIVIAIICFNKFCVGKLVEMIVEYEKISTKTRIHISFAKKFSFVILIFLHINELIKLGLVFQYCLDQLDHRNIDIQELLWEGRLDFHRNYNCYD